LARLVTEVFFTDAWWDLARDDTRLFLTGVRYLGTRKAASEPASSLAILDT